MDYEKLKALTVAATEARAQEMQATAAMQAAKSLYDAASATWKAANDHYVASKKALDSYTEESIRLDAQTECVERQTRP